MGLKSKLITLTEDYIISNTLEECWKDWFKPLHGGTLVFPKKGCHSYYWEVPTSSYVKITKDKVLEVLSYAVKKNKRNLYEK